MTGILGAQNGTVQSAGSQAVQAPLPTPPDKDAAGTGAGLAVRQTAAEADSDEDGPSRPSTLRLPPTRAVRRPLRTGAVRCAPAFLAGVNPRLESRGWNGVPFTRLA